MSKCNFCGGTNLNKIFESEHVPFAQNFVFSTSMEAKECSFGSMKLMHCGNCDAVFNANFDNKIISYNGDYQNEQQHSLVFQSHLRQVLDVLSKQGLKSSSRITEIGCGKGYFVNILKEAGFTNVFGFDASYEGNDPCIINKMFSPGLGIPKSELLVLRHVLEHIEFPLSFLLDLAKANDFQGLLYIEVPDFTWIYNHEAFWDIYHEHVNYFSEKFFKKNFPTSKIERMFDGQYLGVLVDLADFKNPVPYKFASSEMGYQNILQSVLNDAQAKLMNNEDVYVWGGGSKGVMICNYLDKDQSKIKKLIDINPKKWNRFIPLSGHEIISAAEFLKSDPRPGSLVLIANKNYRKEIEEMLPTNLKIKTVEEYFGRA